MLAIAGLAPENTCATFPQYRHIGLPDRADFWRALSPRSACSVGLPCAALRGVWTDRSCPLLAQRPDLGFLAQRRFYRIIRLSWGGARYSTISALIPPTNPRTAVRSDAGTSKLASVASTWPMKVCQSLSMMPIPLCAASCSLVPHTAGRRKIARGAADRRQWQFQAGDKSRPATLTGSKNNGRRNAARRERLG